MKKHQLGFSTFIKLLALAEKPTRTTLKSYLQGRGYDYWRSARSVAPLVIKRRLSDEEIIAKATLGSSHQNRDNVRMLKAVRDWFEPRKVVWIPPPRRKVIELGAGLSVRIEPEIGFSENAQSYLMHLWGTGKPEIEPRVGYAAVQFLKLHGGSSDIDDPIWLVYDTRKNRVYSSEDSRGVEYIDFLEAKNSQLGTIWHDITEPANGDDQPEAPPLGP